MFFLITGKRLLIFASYFDVTYHNILRRRMMVEAIRETRNTRGVDKDGYELKHVADHLEDIIRKSGYEEDEDPKRHGKQYCMKCPRTKETVWKN